MAHSQPALLDLAPLLWFLVLGILLCLWVKAAYYLWSEILTPRDLSELQDLFVFGFFFLDFIYLFMNNTEREAETQVEGEAGSLRGARCGTQSRTPGSCPERKAAQPLNHLGAPQSSFFYKRLLMGSLGGSAV